MVRTICFFVLVCTAIFWLPWYWLVLFFAISIAFSPYAFFFLIPAIGADMVQAPHTGTLFQNHLVFLIVLGMLCVRYLITHKTRITHVYDSTKN